jgi:hypothetical protein
MIINQNIIEILIFPHLYHKRQNYGYLIMLIKNFKFRDVFNLLRFLISRL